MIKRASAAKPRDVVVLSAAYWPPGHPNASMLALLKECTRAVARATGRSPILVDLPPDTFDDLNAGRSPKIIAETCALLDQLFRHDSRCNAKVLSEIKEVLRRTSSDLINNRLSALNLFTSGHFELPGGRHHTDVRINFGSLLSLTPGMDGLRGYLGCVAARVITPYKPGTLVYSTDIRDRVLPRMVRDIRSNLLRMGRHVEDVRITGTYAAPRLSDEEFAKVAQDRPIVLIEDITGAGKRMASARDALSRLNISPVISLAFLRRAKFLPPIETADILSLADVDASVWPRTLSRLRDSSGTGEVECPLRRKVQPIRVDSAAAEPQAHGALASQPRRAVFWSSVLLGGRIGAPPNHDPRHLHDSFVQPSLEPDHLDALMEGVLPELASLGMEMMVYHDTPAAEAMVNRVKALHDPVPAQAITQSIEGGWSLPAGFRGRGESVVIFDDGRNRGEALIDMVFEVEECGFSVVAAVVLEDKLDKRGKFVLDRVTEHDVKIRVFALHSAVAHVRANRASCLAHEVQDAARLMARGKADRPAFALDAYGKLSTDHVWPPRSKEHRAGHASALLELEPNCGVSEQWNQLLLHHQRLTSHTRAMDTIIRDALLEFRTFNIVQCLAELDPAWRERALLWLDPRERIGLPPEVTRPRSCRLSFRLGALVAAATIPEFLEMLELVVEDVEADHDLGERRYLDLALHILRAVLSRQDPEEWLRVGVHALAGCSAPALSVLHEDIRTLSTEFAGRSHQRSKVLAFPWPRGDSIEDPSDEDIEELSRDMWTLDVRGTTASLADNGTTHVVDRHDALTVGVAIKLRRPITTPDVTQYFRDAARMQRRTTRRRFETTLRRLRHPPLNAIASDNHDVRLPGDKRKLSILDRPGFLICYEDGDPFMRELAKILASA